MPLHRIDMDWVAVPFQQPFRIGKEGLTHRHSILLRLYEEDWVGLGEVCPPLENLSGDAPEVVERLWEEIKEPVLRHFFSARAEDHAGAIEAVRTSHASPEVRFGLESALWDLEGQRQNVPVFQLLGGKKTSVKSGLFVGRERTPQELVERLVNFLKSDGYPRIKVYIEPGWDSEPLEAIRRKLPGNLRLVADCGGRYDPEDRSDLIALEEFDLQFVESPFPADATDACALLRREMGTPVCLGARLAGLEQIQQAVLENCCQAINLVPSRIGGLSECIDLAKWLEREGVDQWVGSVTELGVGAMASLHLATLSCFRHPTDVPTSFRWFKDEICRPWLNLRSGEFNLTRESGLGLRISEKALKQYSRRSEKRFRRDYR